VLYPDMVALLQGIVFQVAILYFPANAAVRSWNWLDSSLFL